MYFAEQLKRFLAVVILICFFLPLAQCSAKQTTDAHPYPAKTAPQLLIPAHDVKFESVDEIPIVAMYVWPLAFIAVRAKARSKRSAVVTGIVEAMVSGAVLWCVVQTILLWGTVRYGGVILVSAHVVYLLAVSAGLYGSARADFDRPGGRVRQRPI